MPRPPRLLIVVNVFEPDLGGGILFTDLARGLAERGFDVTVRCAYPYYPEWTDKAGVNGLAITRYEDAGVNVERFGLYIPSDPNALSQRLVYEGSFFASLLRKLPGRGSFDLIMVFCPLMGAVAYAAVAKRLVGCPLWLNVQDLPADAAAAGGISGGGLVGRLMDGTQTALFNQADVWSTISPVMADRLAALRQREQPILHLPNWLHASLARTLAEAPSPTPRPAGEPPRLLYSGNVGTKQDLLLFCRVLSATDAPFAFRIQAGGSRADEVQAWVEATGDPRFSFHGLSDEAGLARALKDADLFVITEKQGAGGSFIPSKLIPAVSAGTPILAVCDDDSPLGREMAEAGPGPRFGWNDLRGLSPLLHDVAAHPDRLAPWRRNALERALYYDRGTVLDRYAAALKETLTPTRYPHE